MKNTFVLFLFSLSLLFFTNVMHAQHKLDFFSPDFQEVWVDQFDYTDFNDIKNSGDYRLDDTRCSQGIDYNWGNLSFYLDDRGNSIMLETAELIGSNCTPDPNIGLDCVCTDNTNYKYRSGGIVTLIQLNDGPDNNSHDDDATNCNSQIYSGVYTGLIEARVKWDASPDSWPAVWLYNGLTEIDLLEGRSSTGNPPAVANQISTGFIDWQPSEMGCSRKTTFERDMSENFHLFSCLWTYNSSINTHTFTVFVDGREIVTRTDFDPDVCPADMRLNLAVHNAALEPFNTLEYEVDYIKVKKFTGNTSRYYKYDFTDIGGGLKIGQKAKNIGVGSNDALFFRTNADQMGFRYQLPNAQQGYYYHILDNLVSGSSQSTKIGGDLVVVVHNSGENKVYYRGQDGLLRSYWYNGNQWNQATLDFAPKGKKNPVSSECGALTGNANDGIFYRGTDDMLHHFFWDPSNPSAYSNGWVHELIGSSGTNNNWLINGDVELAPNGHVYYRGKDDRLQQYYRSSEGTWVHANVDISGVEENKVNSDCGSIAVSNTSVFYRGKDNLMHRMFFEPNFQPSSYPGVMANEWVYETLPFDNYNPQLVLGDIEVPSMIDPNEVYYRGSDSEIQKYSYYDGHWYHSWADDGDGVYTGSFPLPPTTVRGAVEIGESGNIFFVDNNSTDPHINRYVRTTETTGSILNPACESVQTVRLTDGGVTDKPAIVSEKNTSNISPSSEVNRIPELTVSPNPSSGLFTITSSSILSGSVTVKTSVGQIISSMKINKSHRIEIDGSSWPPGVYFLNYVENGQVNLVQKIIKN